MTRAREIADGLTQGQKEALLDGDGDLVMATHCTWDTLQSAGLLDGNFDITPLGATVRAELRLHVAGTEADGLASHG